MCDVSIDTVVVVQPVLSCHVSSMSSIIVVLFDELGTSRNLLEQGHVVTLLRQW